MARTKRMIAALAALMLTALCFTGMTASAEGGLSVGASCDAFPAPGSQGTLVLKLDSVPSVPVGSHVTSVRFTLTYDPALVTFGTGEGYSVTAGECTFSDQLDDRLIFIPEGKPGTVEFCFIDWTTVESCLKGSGPVRDLFRAGQSVALPFTLNASVNAGASVTFTVTSVTYGVDEKIDSKQSIAGTGTTLTKKVSGSGALRGDFTGDGKVTSNDAVFLLRYTLFPAMYPIEDAVARADFTGDGKVTSNDAVYLLRYTLFPAMYPIG